MQIIIVGLIILTFIYPLVASWVFIGIALLLELWFILANRSKIKVKNIDNVYTSHEIKMIERYQLFFQYPMACRALSSAFSMIHLATFLLTPWLLIKGIYLQAVLIGLNYFITTQLSVMTNPQFFLHDNLDKGRIKDPQQRLEFYVDMEAIDSALKKMYSSKSV